LYKGELLEISGDSGEPRKMELKLWNNFWSLPIR